MKSKYNFALILFLYLFSSEFCLSQNPTYILRATNFIFASINFPNDAIEFDIYMQHTNPPTTFEYSGGQYFFSFNSGIIPGNFLDSNIATYRIIGSDLPVTMRPRNPQIRTATNPTATILAMAVNPLPGAGNGFIMTNNGSPGTKITRMRILSKTGSLNPVPLNIQ